MADFSEGAFVTELRDAGSTAPSSNTAEDQRIADARNHVHGLHSKLRGCVDNLSDKISGVMQKQEKEFLSAYRAHMYHVQKELQELRQKCNEKELEMKKNEKIRKLEEERDWYRQEALRLDQFTTAMRKDLKYMKDKLESIEDDRNWLERQLKASKKQNKLLRAELEIRLAQSVGTASGHPDGAGGGNPRGGGAMFPPADSPNLPSVTLLSASGPKAAASSKSLVAGDLSGEERARLKARISQLKNELNGERRALRQMRAATVTKSNEKSELEEFFLKCVEDVKRSISRRRMKQARQRSKSRTGSISPDESIQAARSGVGRARSVSPAVHGDGGDDPRSVGVQDFTANDRRRVIEKLLEEETVMGFLYDHLFPADGPVEEFNAGAHDQKPTDADSVIDDGDAAVYTVA